MFQYNVFYNQPQYMFNYSQPQIPVNQGSMTPTKVPSLSINLPVFNYQPSKQVIIPFDKKLSNDGVFNSMDDAMRFISRHCLKYHGVFNRQLARTYSKLCYVLDLVNGVYCPMNDLSKKDFNASYMKLGKMND